MPQNEQPILRRIDWFTVFLYMALMALGWISVCGASYDPDLQLSVFDLSTRSGMQIIWIGTSLVLALLITGINERVWTTFGVAIYLLFMVLLFVTPFLARDIKGSLSWIKIGSFSIQPAEFAKFATALCAASYISRRGFSMRNKRDFILSCAIIVLPMALIVLQKETGSALVYLSLFLMLYREGLSGSILLTAISAVSIFVVGVKFADTPLSHIPLGDVGTFSVCLIIQAFTLAFVHNYTPAPRPTARMLLATVLFVPLAYALVRWLLPMVDLNWVMLGGVAVTAVYLVYLAIRRWMWSYVLIAVFALGGLGLHAGANYVLTDIMEPHQQTRIRVLLGMEDDPRGAGYNVNQAKIAIGSGGLKGKGFKNGTQTKLKYVPEQDTDFIFCTVGEEQGFMGCAAVLTLFLTLILRLIHLAERQSDRFARVYGYCVLSVFLFHVFINVGMVLGLTPVIGIPLPFFSYGGSSLWGFTILLFIFLRMDAAREREKAKV